MRSKNILASLEETNVAFSKDQETNGLKCNVCDAYLNSIQQLQTHLNGKRMQFTIKQITTMETPMLVSY